MKSKNLAPLITVLFLIVAVIVTAPSFVEGVAFICVTLLGYILINGLYYSIFEIIKMIRNERD